MGKLARKNKTVSLGGVAAIFVLGALGGGTLVGAKLATNRSEVAQTRPDALERPSDFKAFLVGADDYAEAPDLDFVKNDVDFLSERLVEIGVKKENVVVLKSGGDFSNFPTKKNVDALYKKFLASLQEGDFVIVYLSGHGIQATDSKEAFFAPIDVDPNDWFDTSISINKMLTELDESGARFRWMIVDACRNDPGKAITKAAGVKGLTDIVNAPETTALLQSCQPGEFSYGGDGVSVFTSSLLEALDEKRKPADADADGLVTFSEMLAYVERRTNELAEKYCANSQNPKLSGEIPDFVILDAESKRRLSLILAALCGTVGLAVGAWEISAKIAKKKKKTGTDDEKDASRVDERESAVETSETQDVAEGKRRVAALTSREEASTKETSVETTQGARRLPGKWSDTAGARGSLDVRGVTYDFRYCPPSYFLMGSPESELGRDRQETLCPVKVARGFWMLETPVTQRMWESIMGADASWSTVGSNPSWFSATGGGKNKIQGVKDALNLPVENVNWYDCQNFIKNLNAAIVAENYPQIGKFRLPKENEWEYACRAGTATPFFWGTTLNGDEANCNGNYPYASSPKDWVEPGAFLGRTSEPRSYKSNPWGLYDMHGNVCEWCEDCRWSNEFNMALNRGSKLGIFDALMKLGPEETGRNVKRVLRGGSWNDGACDCRSAFRRYCDSTTRSFDFGFRLVLDCGGV